MLFHLQIQNFTNGSNCPKVNSSIPWSLLFCCLHAAPARSLISWNHPFELSVSVKASNYPNHKSTLKTSLYIRKFQLRPVYFHTSRDPNACSKQRSAFMGTTKAINKALLSFIDMIQEESKKGINMTTPKEQMTMPGADHVDAAQLNPDKITTPSLRRWTPPRKLFSSSITHNKSAMIQPTTFKSSGLEEDDSGETRVNKSLTVISYNILAQAFTNRNTFSYSAPHALSFKTRSQKILGEIFDVYDADIVCIQELDRLNFYKHEFVTRGYEVCDKRRSSVKRIQPIGRKVKWPDGCAVLFKNQQYKLINMIQVEFNDMVNHLGPYLQALAGDPSNTNPEKASNFNYYYRDNVAIITVLERCDDSHQRVIVVSAHLYWNPEMTDLKILQAWWLRQVLINVKQSKYDLASESSEKVQIPPSTRAGKVYDTASSPVILCGDLNSFPNSSVLSILCRGHASKNDHESQNVPDSLFDFVNESLKDTCQVLQLENTYSDDEPLTTFTEKFTGTLDYILVETARMHVTATLDLPREKVLREAFGWKGVPNGEWGSDHFAIGAKLALK